MADVWCEVVEFTADTVGGGSQSISMTTHSSDTPKAVYFRIVKATADDTSTAGKAHGWGAADNAFNWCYSCHSDDAVGTTECNKWANKGAWTLDAGGCIALISGTSTLNYEARMGSLDVGGCTLDVVTTASSAWKGVAVFFGGGDLSVDCNFLQMPAALGTVTATTGFETDLCIFGHAHFDMDDSFQVNATWSEGAFAYDDPTITQGAVGGHSRDAQSSTKCTGGVMNAECGMAFTNSNAFHFQFAVTSVTSTTFVVTNTHATATSTDQFGYLAFNTGDAETHVELFNPSSGTTSTEAYTEPGFEPEFLIFWLTQEQTENSAQASSDHIGVGSVNAFAVTDGTTTRCLQQYDEEAVGTTNTNSRYSTNLWYLLDDGLGGADDYDCDLVSLDATGWTLDQSVASSKVAPTGSEYILLATFEKGTGGATTTGRTNPLIGRSPFRGPI